MTFSKTEIRQEAQEDLLHFAGGAFYNFNDYGNSEMTDEEAEAYKKQLDKQYKRIQKIFGFVQTGYRG